MTRRMRLVMFYPADCRFGYHELGVKADPQPLFDLPACADVRVMLVGKRGGSGRDLWQDPARIGGFWFVLLDQWLELPTVIGWEKQGLSVRSMVAQIRRGGKR